MKTHRLDDDHMEERQQQEKSKVAARIDSEVEAGILGNPEKEEVECVYQNNHDAFHADKRLESLENQAYFSLLDKTYSINQLLFKKNLNNNNKTNPSAKFTYFNSL